jgi:hypothetical protein
MSLFVLFGGLTIICAIEGNVYFYCFFRSLNSKPSAYFEGTPSTSSNEPSVKTYTLVDTLVRVDMD